MPEDRVTINIFRYRNIGRRWYIAINSWSPTLPANLCASTKFLILAGIAWKKKKKKFWIVLRWWQLQDGCLVLVYLVCDMVEDKKECTKLHKFEAKHFHKPVKIFIYYYMITIYKWPLYWMYFSHGCKIFLFFFLATSDSVA